MQEFYCLSTQEFPWRRDAVSQRFRDAGITVELFDGLHGNTIKVVPVHGEATPNAVASTFSRMLLWQHASKFYECVIFEDDVKLCDGFKEKYQEAYDSLPDDWQVVNLGTPDSCHALLWKREALAVAMDEFRQADWSNSSNVILQKRVFPKLRYYAFAEPLVKQDGIQSEAALNVGHHNIHGWFNFSRIYDEQLDRVGDRTATFVEVGSWLGASSAYMGQEIKRRMSNVDFYCVDTWEGTPGEEHMNPILEYLGGSAFQGWQVNMLRSGVSHYVTPIRKSSVEAAQEFPDKSLDFVYIDAAHDFDSVVADIQAWLPKVKEGGCLAGHDYNWDGVAKAVEQELAGRYRVWESSWVMENVSHG